MLTRRRLGLDQEEFAKLLGVTRAYVSRLENGHFEISPRVAARLDEIERDKRTNVSAVIALQEDVATYQAGGAPAAQPTEQQIIDHFLASLAVARNVPGGLGYVWSHLKLHLTPEQIKKLGE